MRLVDDTAGSMAYLCEATSELVPVETSCAIDCCLAFDEARACVGSFGRGTEDGYVMGSGAEWRLRLSPTSRVTLTTELAEVEAQVTGEVAFSLCARDLEGEACPFALADAHLAVEEEVSVRFDLAGDLLPEASPPAGTILTPSAPPCGVEVPLQVIAQDPDGDLAEVRWMVDDLLLATDTDQVSFTVPRVLKARLRDARGATTTLRKEVTCVE